MTRETDNALDRRLATLGADAPRITGAHIDACIVGKVFSRIPDTLATVCTLTLYNGWTIHGVNAGPVSPENFREDVGQELAYEAARRQVWPLEGYLLQDRLHRAAGGVPVPAYGDSGLQERVAELEAVVADRTADVEKLQGLLDRAESVLRGDGWVFNGGEWTRAPREDDGGDAAWEAGARRVLERLDAETAARVAAELGVEHIVAGPGGIDRHTDAADAFAFFASTPPLGERDVGSVLDPETTHPDGRPVQTLTDADAAADLSGEPRPVNPVNQQTGD